MVYHSEYEDNIVDGSQGRIRVNDLMLQHKSPVIPAREAARLGPIYDRMWDESERDLRAGRTEIDDVPSDGSRRWGVSVVVKPAPPAIDLLQAAASEAGRYGGPGHIVYDGNNLHTTLRSIEFFRAPVSKDDPHVQMYSHMLHELAVQADVFPIVYHGITATRGGILAQGWDITGQLQALRYAFHVRLAASNILIGPECESVRQTAHASLMVFTGHLINSEKLVDFITKYRSTNLGVTSVTHVELVRYLRTKSGVSLDVLDRIKLGKHSAKR